MSEPLVVFPTSWVMFEEEWTEFMIASGAIPEMIDWITVEWFEGFTNYGREIGAITAEQQAINATIVKINNRDRIFIDVAPATIPPVV